MEKQNLKLYWRYALALARSVHGPEHLRETWQTRSPAGAAIRHSTKPMRL